MAAWLTLPSVFQVIVAAPEGVLTHSHSLQDQLSLTHTYAQTQMCTLCVLFGNNREHNDGRWRIGGGKYFQSKIINYKEGKLSKELVGLTKKK